MRDQILITEKKLKPKSAEIPNEIISLSLTSYTSLESILGPFDSS